MTEDAKRLPFSFLAAAVLLYMGAEYAEYTVQGNKLAIPVAVLCVALAVLEANKVGRRAERIMGLRDKVS